MSSFGDNGPVVVTGATGQLGSAFARLLPEALMLTRSDLDLAEPSSVGTTIERLSPSAVINCAAYTNVDGAEADESTATDVNGLSVGELASVTAKLGIPMVTFSTDYVFDGTSESGYAESDTVNPINAYGRSKLVGERLTAQHNPDALIIRTSWVVSRTHDNFVTTMLRLASEPGSVVRVVDDQRGCPTIADDLARGSLDALRLGTSGLLHVSNGPETTWFDVATFAVRQAGLAGTIEPCSSSEYPRPARRPANSVLHSERLGSMPIDKLPPWQVSMVDVVAAQIERLRT